MNLENLIRNLESDVASVIDWFAANFMVLNADKCHFLLSKPKTAVQQKYIEVGGQVIWESPEETL